MTNEQKKKIYAALAASFPSEAVERTEGRVTGRGYDTTGIKYQYVVNRLNEVLGLGCYRAHRAVSVKEIQTAKGRPAYEAICDLTLQLGEWLDGQFMCWAEALADGGHTSMSEADARKGAYTNAFKKAAAFFGVGKQAYEGTIDDDAQPGDVVQPQSEPQRSQPSPTHQHAPPLPHQAASSALPRNRITSKQLAALWAIARKSGMDQSEFRAAVRQKHGVQPEYLSREVASSMISEMSAQLGNGHAAEFEHRQPGQEG